MSHFDATGSVARGFPIGVHGFVGAIAVLGRRLYVSGPFDAVGGKARTGLAVLDRRTGRVGSWRPRGGVRGVTWSALAVAGGAVIVPTWGGLTAYDARSGSVRWRLALDLSDAPGLSESPVQALVVARGRLFVGGTFDRVRATPARRWRTTGTRTSPIAVDPRTGRVLRWHTARIADEIFSLAADRTTLFVGGHDSGYRVSLGTGRAVGVRGRPSVFAVTPGRLYVGGDFRHALSIPHRRNLAAIDRRSGRVTAFAPRLTRFQSVGAIVPSGRHVLVLGQFLESLG